jgi:hypothetical protein
MSHMLLENLARLHPHRKQISFIFDP